MFLRLRAFFKYIRDNRFDRSLMKYFDWPLFLIVMAISLFGVVCIFSATSSQVTEYPANDAPLFRRVIIIRPVFLVIIAIFYDSVLLSIFLLYTQLCAFCTREAARQNFH